MIKTLTLLFVFAASYSYGQKTKLELNLEKDSTYILNAVAGLQMDQMIPGQTLKAVTSLSGKMANRVTAKHDSIYEMEVSFESLAMHMEVGGRVIDFSTDKDDVFSRLMSLMLKRAFTMSITRQGRVISVANTEMLYKGFLDSIPNITDTQKRQFIAQMKNTFGSKALQSSMQDSFTIFSRSPVITGGTWVTNTALQSTVSAKMRNVYTLNSLTDSVYEISGIATVLPGPVTDYVISNGIPMRFRDVSGTVTSKITIDKLTGWVISSTVIKKVKGNVQIKDSPQIPGGIIFPMTLNASIVTTNK